jgi:hypothetical protein
MHMIWKRIAVLIAAGILVGCSGGETADVPEHILQMENVTIYSHEDVAGADTVRLVRDQVFGDDENLLIGTVGQVRTDAFGRVLISDSQQRTIHLFDSDGRYLTHFGREGDGPGEFQWMGTMQIRSNELVAYDPNGRKLNIFDLGTGTESEPELSNTIRISGESWDEFPEPGFTNPVFHSLRGDGSMLLHSRSSPLGYREDPDFEGVERYYRTVAGSSQAPEPVFEVEMPDHIVTEWFTIPPPFAAREIMTVSPVDRIYSARTDYFLIRKHDSEGNEVRAFYYPFSQKELTRADAVQSVEGQEQLEDAVRRMDLPEKWPALNRMFIDDTSRIWVSVITEHDDIDEWWLLGESGELQARFSVDESKRIVHVNGNSLYTQEDDEETGLQTVVRYRMEMP